MFKSGYLANVIQERGLQTDSTAAVRTPILAFVIDFRFDRDVLSGASGTPHPTAKYEAPDPAEQPTATARPLIGWLTA